MRTRKNPVKLRLPLGWGGRGQGRARRVTKSILAWAKDPGWQEESELQSATLGEGRSEAKQHQGPGKLLASAASACSVAHSQLLLAEALAWLASRGREKPWGPAWRQS